MKKFLFVLRKPPHEGVYTQEMLDVIMTVAAFDQKVALLLLDKAVFQLKNHQNLGENGLKDTSTIFKSLTLYDINDIYVETDSLQEFGLSTDDLNETVIEISRKQVSELCKQFDLILSG